MVQPQDELIPTRATLIQRLKNWQDQASWQVFFDTYWKLIFTVAIQAGLTEVEAQDVVQETMFSVARHMPSFTYDRVGSFKTWLLNMTRWRITDQLRKRGPTHEHFPTRNDSTDRTDTVERVADPAIRTLDSVWEADWEKNLFDAALSNVKRRLDPGKYQIFDFYVNQEWSPERVAKRFSISVDQVYLIKHRVTEAIRVEVKRLENEMT